jgi:ATP-dependent Clp endopeptidase proteolytic subunit ClpP
MLKGKFFNVIATGNGRASLMLYGEIGGEDGVSPEQIVTEMSYLSKEYPMIDVHINSMGGEVFAGIAIFNALKDSPSIVNIYVDGLAASIAGVIALCGKPLHMSRFSRLMLHSVSGSCKGGARDMRECADLIEGLEGTLADMISQKCGMPSEEVKKSYFDGKDHWFTADEAARMGLCDDIYDMAGADSLGSAPTNEQIYQFVNLAENKHSPNNKDMEFIDKIKGIAPFKDLSEDAILAKVKSMSNEAAKVDGLQQQISTLKAENAELKKSATDAFLDQAVSEGRISKEQKDQYRKLMDVDAATTRELINSLPKSAHQVNIQDVLNGAAGAGNATDLSKMSWDEIDKAERLGELKDKFPELYKAKFKEKFGVSPVV